MPLPLADTGAHSQTGNRSHSKHRHRLLDAPRPLRLWHLASLDAPTVAVVWSLGFAHAAGIHLPRWVLVLLALGTWAVYIGDRILDTRSALHSGDLSRLRERHYYHWRHRRLLTTAAIAAATASAYIILTRMPIVIRERDSVLAIAALIYFSGVHFPRKRIGKHSSVPSKEFFVGLIFSAGCALPTLSRLHPTTLPGDQSGAILVSVAFFAMLAWLNCHAIERWESNSKSSVAASAIQLGCIGLVFAAAFYATHGFALLIAGSAGAFLLALLDRFRTRIAPLTLRVSADLALLTPILLLSR
jgi:hypothetical protein